MQLLTVGPSLLPVLDQLASPPQLWEPLQRTAASPVMSLVERHHGSVAAMVHGTEWHQHAQVCDLTERVPKGPMHVGVHYWTKVCVCVCPNIIQGRANATHSSMAAPPY